MTRAVSLVSGLLPAAPAAASPAGSGRQCGRSLALLLFAAGLSPGLAAAALPVDPTVLSVTPTAVRIGESITWTVRGRPGQFAAIAFSLAASGGTFRGTPLALGTDARALFGGTVDPDARFAVTLVVSDGVATVSYYFQAVVADDPAFTRNLTLSAGVTVTVSGPAPPLGTVAGRVTDVGGSRSLAGATVELDEGQFRAVTDAEGRFMIPGVPLGTHTLTTSASQYYPVTVPNVALREYSRDLNLALLRTLVGIPGEPPECPCLITVEVPNVGSAEVSVLIENPFQRFRATASGRSPVTLLFNGPLEEILASRYEVTVSAPGFLTVTLTRVNVPWLLRIPVVLPPA